VTTIFDPQPLKTKERRISVAVNFDVHIASLRSAKGIFLGYLDIKAGQTVGCLRSAFSAHLEAYIVREADKQKMSVDIILYGNQNDSASIGEFLSERGYYLQHPSSCEPSIGYYNPHYFLTPGEWIPRPGGTGNSSSSKSMAAIVDDVLNIFEDSGHSDDYLTDFCLSSLKTSLKEYVDNAESSNHG